MQNIMEKMDSTIQTASGEAVYMGTEVENELGQWNDSWSVKGGYWVIHEGSHHHVYKINKKVEIPTRKEVADIKATLKEKGWTEEFSITAEKDNPRYGTLFTKDGNELWLNKDTFDKIEDGLVEDEVDKGIRDAEDLEAELERGLE